jgi:hypothetical protein
MPDMSRDSHRRHRPDRHEVHKVRARVRTVALVVLAGGLLVLLVVFLELLVGERNSTAPHAPAPIPGLSGPRH